MDVQPCLINLQHSRYTQASGNIIEEGVERAYKPEDQDICCEIVTSSNGGDVTLVESQQNDDTNWHASVMG